ncbi:FAD/NAD(P)-binding domain-containing protein [Penicillium canariense]|uniref:FAD/NAD(P)-binding domain-containing protein n=1 Tax=Penicillium canariense TaxID=189055 RepID=A0A9W9I059_9EURO|nr:FAD/NAD(P)-binding domain-containing protein [Penicillium canariense]KAJ5160821.1 FAD/NAD(P)-binding domain-containing protein [Penicillium canariense]
MFSQSPNALLVLGLLSHSPFAQCKQNTIIRDVAIIGGGASGTFSAVRLLDQGKSVVLIEKESILGGHTNTYLDPLTKQTVDYGVEVFHNQQVVKDFFAHLNVSWIITKPSFGASAPKYLDGNTAEQVNYTSPDPTAALIEYATQLSKYRQLELGFFLPDPIPDDLLLPFGEFLSKYPDIGNATFTIFRFGQGLGDFLEQPTLYVFKNFGLDVVQDIASGFLVTTNQNNYEIYDQATRILGPDALLSSCVVSTHHRDNSGVQLDVETPTGRRIVRAKKLLVAIPQKLENMSPFALDDRESGLFGEFMNTGYYTSLLNNTGLPANFSSWSVGANTSYHLPKLPGVYTVTSTAIEGIFDFKYGSPHALPDDYVRGEIASYVKKMQANGIAEKVPGEPEFVRFSSHTPFELTVSQEQIANGFYEELYALQGYRNTWYTGAAFHTQDSSMLWNFTDSTVLPALLK